VLFVADFVHNKVRTLAIAGSHAATTLASFSTNVNEIALDVAARIMYVCVGSAVYVLTYAGVATLLAGDTTTGYADGTGSAARFNELNGFALDAGAGVLYGAEWYNHRIRRITTNAGVVTTFAGSGNAALVNGVGTAASFYSPVHMSLDYVSGVLYIADQRNNAIRRAQLPLLTPATNAAAPLSPSPLTPTDQLTVWRALGTFNSLGAATSQPVLVARNVNFSAPLAAANTAGLNPAIGSLLLGNVTLAPRDAAPAAAGNTNTTFSTSAQRGLACGRSP